jgi:hypothetical protein
MVQVIQQAKGKKGENFSLEIKSSSFGLLVLFHRATPIVLFPLFRFTAKLEMDRRGSEEARALERYFSPFFPFAFLLLEIFLCDCRTAWCKSLSNLGYVSAKARHGTRVDALLPGLQPLSPTA